jgi:mono/diheme cytochrome c family protein
LAGGAVFPMGPLGEISVPNLTPDPKTGLGRYSDGEVFRMLRHSIRPNGTASLSLIMPFQRMAEEDHVAILSYLRSLEPIEREVPPSQYTLMGKAIRVFAPPFEPVLEPEFPSVPPPMEATPERGEYLARYVANCYTCHTAHDPATFERIGPEFGGGMEFEPDPSLGGEVWTRSPNLTSHESGMLQSFPTAADWISRFRQGRRIRESPMHWGPFSRMTDEDLGAIYAFLQTVPPADNWVGEVTFTKN